LIDENETLKSRIDILEENQKKFKKEEQNITIYLINIIILMFILSVKFLIIN
jgi:predicted nucleic acid-binding Zn ribbon protein